MVANLARLGISVHLLGLIWVPVFSQIFLLALITYSWLLNLPVEGLLPPTGTEPTLFRNSASVVAGL